MHSRILYLFLATLLLLIHSSNVQAQALEPSQINDNDKKIVNFNGLGRVNLQNTNLTGNILETDTVSTRRVTEGEFLLDLALNITPNKKTEIQSILRLRNEFGGFYGAGMSVEVRELFARGIIGNALRYHVGDMDLVMSPFTFYNNDEEGMVNEPEIFRPQKEVIYYENFYMPDNKRRMQGAMLDFGLNFSNIVEQMDVKGFFTRVRGTDFFTIPSRYVGGGQVYLRNARFGNLGFHYINTYDDLKSGQATSGLRNEVFTFNGDIRLIEKDKMRLSVMGETGLSSLRFKTGDSVITFDTRDFFYELGASLLLKPQHLKFTASYLDVGPDFFSTGAQSKKVDFTRTKSLYNRLGNEQEIRQATLFDLGRDRSLYTYQLSDKLMRYDPRFSNTFPYGKATPNRRGLTAQIEYQHPKEFIEAGIDFASMSEIRGQGTFELKSFLLAKALANYHLGKQLDWKKGLTFTLGLQYEQTSRGGLPVEQVDLNSFLLELGLEAELIPNLDLLLGIKNMSASGNDVIPDIRQYNEVANFIQIAPDDTETLLGAGLRYRFKEGIYLTAQYQSFNFQRATDAENNYGFNQWFILYSMDL